MISDWRDGPFRHSLALFTADFVLSENPSMG